MKKLLGLFFLLLNISLVSAQNEKSVVLDANVEMRKASGFTSIEVSGSIDLFLSQGTEEGVAVSASSDEIRERIKAEVRGNTLHIYLDGKGLNWKKWSNNKMKAYVSFINISGIEASGACNVKTSGKIKSTDLTIEMSGASDFTGELSVNKLKIEASGASNFRLSGSATNATIEASSASNIKAYELKVDNCKITTTGASDARITVNKELNAQASGGSSIYYRGEGLIRDINTSGAANVKRSSEN